MHLLEHPFFFCHSNQRINQARPVPGHLRSPGQRRNIINPDTIKAQIESSIVYGLTATLYGEITIKNGRVEQNHFFDYPILPINEMPEIEVYIVPSAETPGGVGEPAVPPIASAVVNAIFAATGKRIRRLPVRPEELRTA